MEILRDKCSIRTGIWTIEQNIVGSRSPIHLTYTLEEYSEIKAEVLETQVYAVVVSWLIVSNDSAVTRIIHGGSLALIDDSVTIQVKKLDISSVKSALIAGSRDNGLIDKGLVNLITAASALSGTVRSV